jgi:hypothetical protein
MLSTSWQFGGIYNVENKRQLESKSDIDDCLVTRLNAVERQAQEARANVEKELNKREKHSEEVCRVQFAFERKFAVVERKLLKVSTENRNFRILLSALMRASIENAERQMWSKTAS